MRKYAEAKWRPARPAYDDWVGVGHGVLRYDDRLAERVDRFDFELGTARFEHRQQITGLQTLLAEKDREIGRLQQEPALAKERVDTTSRMVRPETKVCRRYF